jgi:glycosyltransferase involved in cell wall biosynthesis
MNSGVSRALASGHMMLCGSTALQLRNSDMQIVHFEREPIPENHSIERVFEVVRGALPGDWERKVVHCPTPHHSVFWLIKGILHAWAEKGEVNHIVGDVHYVALALPKSKCILTVHDLNHLYDLKGLRRILYRLLYFSIPLRRCAVITAISEVTRDLIVKEFPFTSNRIIVIADPLPRGYEYRPKSFNSDYPWILQVGTAPHKNVGRLVQALSGLPCKLHMIGLLNNETRRSLESSRIDFENSVNITDAEMVDAYERADLVIFVSLAEGFGMPIIEAQAVGRPVIVSNLSPMKEVAGEGALAVDPFDIEAIRSAIRTVIEDGQLRHRMIAAGLENVKRFNAEVVAGQYAQLYRSIAKCK